MLLLNIVFYLFCFIVFNAQSRKFKNGLYLLLGIAASLTTIIGIFTIFPSLAAPSFAGGGYTNFWFGGIFYALPNFLMIILGLFFGILIPLILYLKSKNVSNDQLKDLKSLLGFNIFLFIITIVLISSFIAINPQANIGFGSSYNHATGEFVGLGFSPFNITGGSCSDTSLVLVVSDFTASSPIFTGATITANETENTSNLSQSNGIQHGPNFNPNITGIKVYQEPGLQKEYIIELNGTFACSINSCANWCNLPGQYTFNSGYRGGCIIPVTLDYASPDGNGTILSTSGKLYNQIYIGCPLP